MLSATLLTAFYLQTIFRLVVVDVPGVRSGPGPQLMFTDLLRRFTGQTFQRLARLSAFAFDEVRRSPGDQQEISGLCGQKTPGRVCVVKPVPHCRVLLAEFLQDILHRLLQVLTCITGQMNHSAQMSAYNACRATGFLSA